MAIDPASGREERLLELDLPDAEAHGLSAVRCAGVWIVESRDQIAGFEAESERRLWHLPRPESAFRLSGRGATPYAADDAALPFWAVPRGDGAEIHRLDPRTGTWTAVARVPFSLVDLFLSVPARLLVGHATHGLTSLDPTSGTAHWTVHIPEAQGGDDVLGPVLVRDRAWIGSRSWGADGPLTTLSPVSLDGRGIGAPIRLDGALDWMCASRDLLGVVTTHPRRERVVSVLYPGGPRAELVMPEELGPVWMTADAEGIAVLAQGGRLAFATTGPSGIVWTEAPLPAGIAPHGAFVNGILACSVGHDVLLVDTKALRGVGPPRPRRDARVTRGAARPSASASSEPAEVVVAGASSMVLVEHPQYGRVPLGVPPGQPRPLKGDKIAFEEISEKPGGVIEVHRWRVLGGPDAATAEPETLAGDWADVPRDKPFVKGDAVERLGDRDVPPLLRQILERHDADPTFRWLCAAATGLRWQVAADARGLDAAREAGAFRFTARIGGQEHPPGLQVHLVENLVQRGAQNVFEVE